MEFHSTISIIKGRYWDVPTGRGSTLAELFSGSPLTARRRRRRRMMINDLPYDIILFNVFPRLPVKLLMKLRCVCKLWRDMIDDPSFIQVHLNIAIQEPGLLLILHDPKRPPAGPNNLTRASCYVKEDGRNAKDIADDVLGILFDSFSLKNHCNGLLFFLSYNADADLLSNYSLFIYNPLIREVAMLPRTLEPPKLLKPTCFRLLGLGFSPSTREYKIVGVAFIGAWIHTLGTTSWRPLINHPVYRMDPKTVYADGALHWKFHSRFYASNNNSTEEYSFVSFDIGKEKFLVTRLPNLRSKRNDLMDIIEFRGCLAVVDLSSSTKIEIWMMNKRNNQWNREYSIKIPAAAPPADGNSDFRVISPWGDGEILLSCNQTKFYSYNPKTDKIREIHFGKYRRPNWFFPSYDDPGYIPIARLKKPVKTISEVHAYSRSLVSVKPYGWIHPYASSYKKSCTVNHKWQAPFL